MFNHANLSMSFPSLFGSVFAYIYTSPISFISRPHQNQKLVAAGKKEILLSMARVHPQALNSPSSCSSSSYKKKTTFTVWMKSLVMNGYGCTVFDSNGQLVYRVDNYDHKCGSQVFLMDTKGKLLFAIVKKKLRLLGRWEGYNSTSTGGKPEFRVKQRLEFSKGQSKYKVVLGLDTNRPLEYRMEMGSGKSCCKIVDNFGNIVAEAQRKVSSSGVDLGEDVLSMVVHDDVDHSLVMALMVVQSLINRKM